MKSTIRKIIALSLLVMICLSVVACETTATSAYSKLYDHVAGKVDNGTAIKLPYEAEQDIVAFIFIENDSLYLSIQEQVNAEGYRIDVKFEPGTPDSLTWIYRQASGTNVLKRAEAKLELRSYTGMDMIAFDDTTGFPLSELTVHRLYATDMTNIALMALDEYCVKNLDVSVTELGFVSLSDKFLYTDTTNVEGTEDLGSAFSSARISYALRMTLLGMGMVFAVLALLWIVLAIFKKALGGKEPAKEKPAPVAPVAPSPAPVAPAADEGATVAAITAAIAAMIESDPALRSQFAGGFRVVSFKKKSGKTAWNR